MILCKYCNMWPIIPPNKSYCSAKCYSDAKKIRERYRKTPPKPQECVKRCMGPCGMLFTSEGPWNRVCDRCKKFYDRCVPLNGY
jgi:hypothetical protein